MVFLNLVWRLANPVDHQTVHEAAEQSPLHILPQPVLIILALACLLLAACVAGLTLGLMGLNTTALGIVMLSNDPKEAAAAKVIKPVRDQGNLLLVTLLFANTIATELLPLVLEALVPGGYFSLIVSVITIMLFGEIIPQAICSRHPLVIGSKLIGFVKVLRAILYPVSAPIAYLLDKFLGEELATVYDRGELKGLIDVHAVNGVVTHDETVILKGALDFSEKIVSQILTPAKNVYMLDIDTKLDRDAMLKILRNGHSRIPIFDGNRDNIICLLLVKQLILVNPVDAIPIRSLISTKKKSHKVRVAPALECAKSTLIADLLNEFQKGRSHMAIVYDSLAKSTEEREFVGIVSIEDIIEEILQEEIVDETDLYTDNTNQDKVLVRNSDGKLVRTTNILKSAAVRVSGTNTTILIKEIDVPTLREPLGESTTGERFRPDWKKKRPRQTSNEFISVPSASQPLLGYEVQNDMELGEVTRKGYATDGSSSFDVTTQTQQENESQSMQDDAVVGGMQYANLPENSTSSLFYGEDDAILPEDFAKQHIQKTITLSPQNSAANRSQQLSSDASDSKKQLQLRPLPDNASAQRYLNIPPRHRFAGGDVPDQDFTRLSRTSSTSSEEKGQPMQAPPGSHAGPSTVQEKEDNDTKKN